MNLLMKLHMTLLFIGAHFVEKTYLAIGVGVEVKNIPKDYVNLWKNGLLMVIFHFKKV